MRGLKTQESVKFKAFFEVLQKFAVDNNVVFFLDAGDGRTIETDLFEGEDLMGWFIPIHMVDDFQKHWKSHDDDESFKKWNDYFGWALWKIEDDKLAFDFSFYD